MLLDRANRQYQSACTLFTPLQLTCNHQHPNLFSNVVYLYPYVLQRLYSCPADVKDVAGNPTKLLTAIYSCYYLLLLLLLLLLPAQV
jgi:hypothetical protein